MNQIIRTLWLSAFILFFSTSLMAQEKEQGMASYYHDKFEGRSTASGEPYSKIKYTAAHRTLAFGTRVRVTNLENNKSVIVTVNDRGPFVKGRVIDVSRAAATELGFVDQGVARVEIEVLTEKD